MRLSAQTTSGTNINTTFTFSSSDTSVLTIAPNGVACAGHWDVAFTTCTPGGTGAVQVTASALGAIQRSHLGLRSSAIDSISVVGVLLDGVNVQEPCLSQSQSMTVEAHAFSQGVDITSSVGPFTWSANNSSVVTLIPTRQLDLQLRYESGHRQGHISRNHTDLRLGQRSHQFLVPTTPVSEFARYHFASSRFL